MSHEGKMRRGELSNDPTNIDRIYFLEQSKPKEEPEVEETEEEVEETEEEEKEDGSD